jgi:hypothetical protein
MVFFVVFGRPRSSVGGRGLEPSMENNSLATCDLGVTPKPFLSRRPEETVESIVDLLSRGVSVAGIAAREDLTAKRSRPEMAPQGLEKIEFAPGNGMGSEPSDPQDVVRGRAAPCAAPGDKLRENYRKYHG